MKRLISAVLLAGFVLGVWSSAVGAQASGAYEAGDRVLHNGWPYEAKWWSQGDVPGADVANPWDSPWGSLAPLPGEEVSPGG